MEGDYLLELKLSGLEETEKFGYKLGKLLKKDDILCLNGELGAGKTTMTKSIGLGLGVDEYITSPTFSLINQYDGDLMVYHFDVYRLENVEDIYDLGFDEYFFGGGVCIIEWAEKIERFLPKDIVVVDIKKGTDLNERTIQISGDGKRYKEIIEELE